MTTQKRKVQLAASLLRISKKMTTTEKMELALSLSCSLMTVRRYMAGTAAGIGKIEFAEKMIEEANKILTPETANA